VRNNPLVSLKKQADFNRVFNSKKSAANKLFVVYAAVNALPYNRLGLSISKKVGCAVVRNRIRRLVKECMRLKPDISGGHDIIVIARSGSPPDSFVNVSGSLSQLLRKLGLT